VNLKKKWKKAHKQGDIFPSSCSSHVIFTHESAFNNFKISQDWKSSIFVLYCVVYMYLFHDVFNLFTFESDLWLLRLFIAMISYLYTDLLSTCLNIFFLHNERAVLSICKARTFYYITSMILFRVSMLAHAEKKFLLFN
jgi:hypothetical protein